MYYIKNYAVGIITGASIVGLIVMTYIAWSAMTRLNTIEAVVNSQGQALTQVVNFLTSATKK